MSLIIEHEIEQICNEIIEQKGITLLKPMDKNKTDKVISIINNYSNIKLDIVDTDDGQRILLRFKTQFNKELYDELKNKGTQLYEEEKYKECIECFIKASQLNEFNDYLYRTICISYMILGNNSKALDFSIIALFILKEEYNYDDTKAKFVNYYDWFIKNIKMAINNPINKELLFDFNVEVLDSFNIKANRPNAKPFNIDDFKKIHENYIVNQRADIRFTLLDGFNIFILTILMYAKGYYRQGNKVKGDIFFNLILEYGMTVEEIKSLGYKEIVDDVLKEKRKYLEKNIAGLNKEIKDIKDNKDIELYKNTSNNLGKELFLEGKYKECLKYYLKESNENESSYDYYIIGSSYLMLGNYSLAIKYYKACCNQFGELISNSFIFDDFTVSDLIEYIKIIKKDSININKIKLQSLIIDSSINCYDIKNFEVIHNNIINSNLDLEITCLKFINITETQIVKLIYSENYYKNGDIKNGDIFYNSVKKIIQKLNRCEIIDCKRIQDIINKIEIIRKEAVNLQTSSNETEEQEAELIIKQCCNEAIEQKSIAISKPLDRKYIAILPNVLKKCSNYPAKYCTFQDGKFTLYVHYRDEENDLNYKESIKKAHDFYNNKNYIKCIEYCLKASQTNDLNPYEYYIMGMSNKMLGNFLLANQYFVIAYLSYKSFNNKSKDKLDITKDKLDIISKELENTKELINIYKKNEIFLEDFEINDIDNYYGINNFNEIHNFIVNSNLDVDSACFKMNLDLETTMIIKLTYSYYYYYRKKDYIKGFSFLNSVETIINFIKCDAKIKNTIEQLKKTFNIYQTVNQALNIIDKRIYGPQEIPDSYSKKRIRQLTANIFFRN